MELEPKTLDAPLYRRDWDKLWFAFASAGLGWLWHKPTHIPAMIISCVVGGLAIWLVLGPGLYQFKYHSSPIIRGLTFVASISGLLIVVGWIVPLLHQFVAAG